MSANEIFRFDSSAIRLSYSGGELKTKESDSSTGFAVRVLEDGRIGFGHCQHESEIPSALERAKSLSRFSVRSGFSFAPKADYRVMEILDSSASTDDAGPLRGLVESARDAASSQGGKPRIISSFERADMHLENSEGFSGSYAKTVFSMYVECMHDDGFGFHYASMHHVPKDVAQFGRYAAEMASSMRKAGKPESGTYTIVMGPEALENLIDTLLPSLSGDWKRRGITLLAGKRPPLLGKAQHLRRRPRTGGQRKAVRRRRDAVRAARAHRKRRGEIIPLRPRDRRPRVTCGNQAPARGARTTRRPESARRTSWSPPGTGTTSAQIGRHLEIRSAHGSHTANPTTGDIGLEVSAGYLVDKGEKKPIKGFMLSGNVFDMLSSVEGAERAQQTFGSLIAPRMAFSGVRVVS